MASIDERVVEMKFNNGQFQKGVSDTTSALGKLKSGLNLGGAAKGISELDAAGKRFSLAGMADGVASIQNKLTTMSLVGITALTNLTNRAVDAGLRMGKALTIQPISEGFQEYELKMGSIQTILSNTARHGTGLKEVTASLDGLNEYADKTIYNFGDMTRNIGLFTNAGMKVEDATSVIKGFSNEAAASGTNSQGAASAAYQLSQAMSAGTIRLMDWRSLQNVGMGNKNMQNGLIELADSMGELDKAGVSAKTVADDFNGSLEKKWLGADVMSNYLKIMAGDLTVAEQKTLGLSDAQIKGFQKQQKMSEEAATKVRTWTQLFGTLQEAVGSGWSESFDILLGDFNEATELFTAAEQTLGGMLGQTSDARNKILQEWSDLGGRDLAIQAIGDAFKALLAVLKPIKEAFLEIFPMLTGKDLYNFTAALAEVAKNMMIGEEAANNLKRTFKGVFALLDIGWMIIKGVAGVLFDLIGVVFQGSGGFLEFTGNIGDWIVAVRDALKNGEGLGKFFEGLGDILRIPIKAIQTLFSWLGEKVSPGGLADAGAAISENFNPLKALGKVLKSIWDGFLGVLKWIWEAAGPIIGMMGDFFGDFGSSISDAFSNLDFDRVLAIINTSLFGGLILLFKNFLGGGWLDQLKGLFGGGGGDEGGGLMDSIKDMFGGLTDSLSAMQNTLKAATLLGIAAAIALLAASVSTLADIDAADLGKAVGAIAVMMVELSGAMMLLSMTKGFLRLPFIAGSLILLAIAVRILASAAEKMAELDWEEIAKGLTGTAGLLGSLALFQKFSTASKGSVASAFGLILLGTAINILAVAVGKFGDMDWGEIAKGLTTLAGVFALVAGFIFIVGKSGGGMVGAGVGMIAIAAAMSILTGVLERMSKFSWEEIAKSMVMLAGSLAILAGGMYLMTAAIPGALALIVAATALNILVPVLESMGAMGWDEIGKGLVTLGGSLLVLAGGMYLMAGAIPGAIALMIVSSALTIFVPVLQALGAMEWSAILTGLGALALALGVLGIAGMLIVPALPGLLGLGIALTLLGAAILLAGVGVLAFAIGFGLLVTAVAGGTVLLVAAVKEILMLIPFAMEQLGLGLVALVEALAANAVAITEAFVTIGMAILNAINTLAPEIVATLLNLIWLLVNTLKDEVPKFVTAGAEIIVGFLNGIADNIGNIIDAGVEVIVKFLEGIRKNQDEVADEAVKTIVGFVNAAANAIENNTSDLETAGKKLGWAVADGMTGGLASKVAGIASKAWELGKTAIENIRGAVDSNSPSKESMYIGEFVGDGLALGMDHRTKDVANSGNSMGNAALDSMRSALSNMASVIDTNMDVTPTITPVLDLSNVASGAKGINTMLRTPSLNPDISSNTALRLSQAEQRRIGDRDLDIATNTMLKTERPIQFIQTNNSPKALSEVEIYRQTNNLMSQAKGALNS